MDTVQLLGLELEGGVGVYEHERSIRQRLVVDVVVETSILAAARTDDLSKTVDYDRLAEICQRIVSSHHHNLIERIAELISGEILHDFSTVKAVRVRVQKPGAVRAAQTVAVEIERRRRRSARARRR